jgi:predicted phage terminase large subunit-like protein
MASDVTPTEAQQRQAILEAMRLDPVVFAHYASHGTWQPAAHLRYIAREMLRTVDGLNDRLMINAPPRGGKSQLVSRFFPAWFLGNHPEAHVLLLAYADEFAESWGRRVRTILEEWGEEVFGIKLEANRFFARQSAGEWTISEWSGGMVSVGLGGQVHGRGANLLLIEDPMKAAEAGSVSVRDRVDEDYQATALTRLEPGGKVILIMSRLHADDLSGRILAREADRWKVVRIPAIAEVDEQLGDWTRVAGTSYWPDRYSLEELTERRAQVGSAVWLTQYQQAPELAEASEFFPRDILRSYRVTGAGFELLDPVAPRILSPQQGDVFGTVDLASSTSASADWSVVLIWKTWPTKEHLLIDMVRERIPAHRHQAWLEGIARRYHVTALVVERIGSVHDDAFVAQLANRLRPHGIAVQAVRVTRSKEDRARVAASKMERGEVYLPQDKPWRAQLEAELLAFPRGRAHDDIVDCFSLAATAEIRGQAGLDLLGQAIRNVNERGGSYWHEDYFAEVDRLRRAAGFGGASPLVGPGEVPWRDVKLWQNPHDGTWR